MIPVSKLFTVQEQSNSLSSYTLKGIEYLDKISCFAKERAAIEEEYSTKLKSLSKKYVRKNDDEEVWKSVTYIQGFNGILHQLDIIATNHHQISEQLKSEVYTYAAAKCVQHKSTRKQTMIDLATIDDNLATKVNELIKNKKNYLRNFKEAESAFQKYTKADKNMEISRLELEKAKNHSNMRRDLCEDSKSIYMNAVEAANQNQTNYFDNLLPMIFEKIKTIDKERIIDTKEVLQRFLNIENNFQQNIEECKKNMQQCIDHINPEYDAELVKNSVEATIERPAQFEIDDLGDPHDFNHRQIDNFDGKRIENVFLPLQKKRGKVEESPGKKRSIRQLFRLREKTDTKEISDDEDYSELPPEFRLKCLSAKIDRVEKDLEKAIHGREGLNRLQNAYRENPKHGNPSDCNEPLIQHAKEIERLTMKIENLKTIYSDVEIQLIEAGDNSERSYGGRDTPDTTRSISLCSTNASSKTNTLEDVPAGLYGDGICAIMAQFNIGENTKNDGFVKVKSLSRIATSSSMTSPTRFGCLTPSSANSSPLITRTGSTPLRRAEISSPILKSSVSESGDFRKFSSPGSSRSMKPLSSPVLKEKKEDEALALFTFEGNSYETISIDKGDRVFIVEKDTGDGWTKVKKLNNDEGFVPTSYLKSLFG